VYIQADTLIVLLPLLLVATTTGCFLGTKAASKDDKPGQNKDVKR
jgi:hypothetical protein